MADNLIRINTLAELQKLAKDLGVGHDWHEPDNQGVNVFGFGSHFDNAGFWGLQHLAERETHDRTRLVDPNCKSIDATLAAARKAGI